MKARTAKNPKRGVLPAALTPLHVHARGMKLEASERDRVRERMGRLLGRLAPAIERASVSFEDVDGARGHHETLCRVKVFSSELPSVVVVDEQGASPREAFDRAATGAARSVKRALERSTKGPAPEPPTRRRARRPEIMTRGAERNPIGVEGSLIDKRVGHTKEKLRRVAAKSAKRDEPVDTAAPGRSATDRKAGGGSTARRNVKLNTAGMTSRLEDSATGRPSRKSTRASADRTKRTTNLELRAERQTTSPKARARRATAKRKIRGSKAQVRR